jgi:AcrR family transcriptional regulator
MTHKKENLLDTERSIQRRNQVLDAASTCFRQHGFHGASMAQISKLAGMSPGHIYHYFANKEAIISAIVQRDLEDMIEWTNVFGESDNILQTLVDCTEQGFECHSDPQNSTLMLEILAESARSPQIADSVRLSNKISRDRFIRLLEMDLVQRHLPVDRDVLETKTDVLTSMFEGLMTVSMNRNKPMNKADVVALMQQVIRFILLL